MSRIIAGRRKGQRVAMPPGDRTRPTSDRVRESAFNLIAAWAGTAGEPGDHMLERFSFLDLYGGSGAVGLEAASRGAGPVVAVEKDALTAALARRNAAALGLEVSIVTASVDAYLATTALTAFDVVWFDPPYAVDNQIVSAQVARVLDGGWIAPDGLIVVERSARDEPFAWPSAIRSAWTRTYGETALHFGSAEPDAEE